MAAMELLVIGHKNPDTDASTAAAALAALINELGWFGGGAHACILGPLPPQARYVFQRAGLNQPRLVDHLRPRLGDIATTKVETLSPQDTLRDAAQRLISGSHTVLPVVDEKQHLLGMFSHRRDAFKHMLAFSMIPLLGHLMSWSQICKLPQSVLFERNSVPEEILGSLRVALANQSSDFGCESDDILVCASLDAWRQIPESQRPSRVIVVGNSSKSNPDEPEPDSWISYAGDVPSLLYDLQLQVEVGALDLGTGTCLGVRDEVRDVLDLVTSAHHAVPVLDEQGKLFGLVATSDLQRSVARKLVLVDHFETSQSAPGLEHCEVVAIFDHHRVGSLETNQPVLVNCRPVGSSCTIVACSYRENAATPSPAVATLMLGGIISDTLGLRSPTTTEVDREQVKWLCEIAQLDWDTFSLEVLMSGDDLLTADPASIWERDRKEFTVANRNFSIAQLETVSLEGLSDDHLQKFRQLLGDHHRKSGEHCSYLFVTDVLKGFSWGTCFERDGTVGAFKRAFGQQAARPDFCLMPGVVSRKKQVLPKLLEVLSSMG